MVYVIDLKNAAQSAVAAEAAAQRRRKFTSSAV
jgi:hypothetical protein